MRSPTGWLVLASVAGAGTVERLVALIGSAGRFPGISVLGIAEVLLPAAAAALFAVRWRDRSTGARRSWSWLLVSAFSAFVTLLLLGAATLASRPGGLAPSGAAVVLAGGAIAALAWRRSRRA